MLLKFPRPSGASQHLPGYEKGDRLQTFKFGVQLNGHELTKAAHFMTKISNSKLRRIVLCAYHFSDLLAFAGRNPSLRGDAFRRSRVEECLSSDFFHNFFLSRLLLADCRGMNGTE